MNPIQRAQDILLRPRDTWPVIAAEPASVASIYQGWLLLVAAVPALATFIGMSIVGMGGFGFGFRVPIVTGLVNMVVGYVLSLVAVYVLALIVDALAPTFGGTKNPLAALKVVAYGSAAGFLGGIFSLLPALSILGVLAALYSIYLIYTGLPVLMRNPPEKSAAYTAVVVIAGIVAMVILGAVTSMLLPSRHMGFGGLGGGPDVTLKVPGGEIEVDTARMEEMARQMEAAGKRMEEANQRGDADAAGKALGQMMGAMGGATGGGQPIPAAELKALLPQSVAGLARQSFEAQGNAAMGVAASSARATYGDGTRRVDLKITDMGSMAGLAGMAAWANMTVDRETDGEVEKVYKQGARTVREEYRKDGSHGEVTVILPNGVIVEADGEGVEAAALKQAVESVDLGKLEAMQRPAKS